MVSALTVRLLAGLAGRRVTSSGEMNLTRPVDLVAGEEEEKRGAVRAEAASRISKKKRTLFIQKGFV